MMWFAFVALVFAFQATPGAMSDAEIEALAGRLSGPVAAPSIVAPHLAEMAATPAPSTAPTPSEMFDLICTGRMETTGRRPTPLADLRFRVDLKTKRYCVGPCREMNALTVYPATLVFIQGDEMVGGSRMQFRQSIDRHTGAFEFVGIGNGSIARQETGQCTVAPYTGQVRGERLF